MKSTWFFWCTSCSGPWFIDCDNLSLSSELPPCSSHGDAPMNDKHVQTERSEWGLSPVPAGSVEPAPECQSKRPLHPKLFDKDWTAGPFFSLACLHDPDLQCGYGVKNQKKTQKLKGATTCMGEKQKRRLVWNHFCNNTGQIPQRFPVRHAKQSWLKGQTPGQGIALLDNQKQAW